MPYLKIINTDKDEFTLNICRKFSILTSISGAGKTFALKLNEERKIHIISDSDNYPIYIEFMSDLNVVTIVDAAESSLISNTLLLNTTQLLILDEDVIREYFKDIIESKHYVVGIMRTKYLHAYVSAWDIYRLELVDMKNFAVQSLLSLFTNPCGKYDLIFTEAEDNKSENSYIKAIFPEVANIVLGCKGRNKIVSRIRKYLKRNTANRILVIFDSIVGADVIYDIITSDWYTNNIEVSVIEYTSFEALLYYSKLVQQLPSVQVTKEFNSLEQYMAALLEATTKDYPTNSKHVKFSDCFIKECDDCCEQNTPNVLLKTLFSKEGLPILKWYWETYHPEWIPLTDDTVNLFKSTYNPKGFIEHDVKFLNVLNKV